MTNRRIGASAGRRRFLKGVGLGATALSFPLVLTPRKTRAAVNLTVRDPGGPYTEAFAQAYYGPFNEMKKGEVIVTGVIGKHEPTSQIKSMVDTGTYTWNAALLSESAHNLLRDADYLEPLEIDDDPNVQDIPAHFRTPYLMGLEVFATILGYRTDVYPAKARAPDQGWADLWDIEGIPGRRAMRKHPFDTIEEALMADGVPLADVYPCDFDRAFASLDEIKPHIDIWWTGGAQTSQLLSTGEVDICPSWNARVQAAIDGGAPVAISWTQGLWSNEGWCILKGTPHADLLREFIKFCARPEQGAIAARYLSYGPTNPKAYEFIEPERAKVLSTNPEYLEMMRPVDYEFWGKEKDRGVELFNAWLLG